MFKSSALVAGILGLVMTSFPLAIAGDDPTSVPRVPAERCRLFFKSLQKYTDDELALLPYVRKSLTQIYAVLNAPGLMDLSRVENLVKADTRGFSYQLEGIAKALQSVDAVYYETMRDMGKVLENSIGDYVFETEMLEALREDPALKAAMTPRIEAHFQGRILSQRARLNQNLERFGWIGENKVYGRMMDVVQNSESIEKKSTLKKKILQSMADDLRKTHADVMSGKLDPTKIEEGIHKLRREVRSIPILIMSFPGMFYLDETIKVKKVTISDEDLKSKFIPDESDLLKRAVGISKDGFYYIGSLVRRLGKMKSSTGIKEYVHSALEEAVAEDDSLKREAEPLLGLVSPTGSASRAEFEKTRAEAKALFNDLQESKIFLQLATQFEAAKEEF